MAPRTASADGRARLAASGLYAGLVVHARTRPRRHALRHGVFSLLLDLDELADLDRGLRLFGHNRRALFGLHDSDHGDGGPLRPWVEAQARAAGIDLGGGRVRLLCYPRILGYVFNPLSVYFCDDAHGRLAAILYEVHNTYGERHTYVIPVAADDGADAAASVRQACDKAFHVSPFIDRTMRYRFRIVPPGERVAVGIQVDDAEGTLLSATFQGRRRPLDDRALAWAFLRYPLMTLKVTAAIHWHALRLWLKGVRFLPHAAAAAPVARTIVAVPDPEGRNA
ncbi:DUF1365 domain-containing protein [Zavarzinia sp. CC-PAN008]|uniref:DUF1365 domain-containing protein n=1 Tax=Zavarzinia sp. CC-PAN008 TaxID=3243332 RepID=UPI003F7423C5